MNQLAKKIGYAKLEAQKTTVFYFLHQDHNIDQLHGFIDIGHPIR